MCCVLRAVCCLPDDLVPVKHYPVQVTRLQIGANVVTGFVCASTGSYFALVSDSEECQFGAVRIGARCVMTAAGLQYVSPFQYVAIKVQDKVRLASLLGVWRAWLAPVCSRAAVYANRPKCWPPFSAVRLQTMRSWRKRFL